MIPRRVWINLAVFFALFALLSNWAVRNVLRLDAIERPYSISAAFATSPGLRANQEVTYLGARVGTIDSVRLVDGHVRVDMDVDRGAGLPRGLSAAVRRKSAIGEPYVALEAPAGYAGEGPFVDPTERYAIPITSTSVPLSYGELFRSLGELVSAVPPGDLHTVVHELALALDGRGDELRRLIVNTEDITGTLASRTDLLDELASELTVLVDAISSDPAALSASFDNVAALTDRLAASAGDVAALLEHAPEFGEQVASLLDATVADLACTFADAGALFAAIGTDEHVADIVTVLQTAAAARDALDNALVETGQDGADGPYLGGGFTLRVGEPPPIYDPRPEFPSAPARIVCDVAGGVATEPVPDSPVPGVTGGPAAADATAPAVPPPPQPAVRDVPASSPEDFGRDGFPVLPILVTLAVLLGVVLVARRVPLPSWLPLAGSRREEVDK